MYSLTWLTLISCLCSTDTSSKFARVLLLGIENDLMLLNILVSTISNNWFQGGAGHSTYRDYCYSAFAPAICCFRATPRQPSSRTPWKSSWWPSEHATAIKTSLETHWSIPAF